MKIGIVYFHDPGARQDGGSMRVLALVDALQALGHAPAVVTAGEAFTAGEKGASSFIHALKRRYLPMPLELRGRRRSLQQRLAEQDFDLILPVSMPHMSAALALDQMVWADFPDLFSAFARREAAARSGLPSLGARVQAEQNRRREASYMSRASVSTFAGYEDHRQAQRAAGPDGKVFLPTPVPTVDVPEVRGRVAGFLGNFHYWPNVDAYERLVRYWAGPLSAAGWRLVVAGHGSEGLPRADGIEYLGTLPEVSAFYARTSLVLAPICLGGGMKVKVVEALLAGRPVLASEHVAAGFPLSISSMLAVTSADHPLDPAVLQDPVLRASPAPAALRQFSLDHFTETVRRLLSEITTT